MASRENISQNSKRKHAKSLVFSTLKNTHNDSVCDDKGPFAPVTTTTTGAVALNGEGSSLDSSSSSSKSRNNNDDNQVDLTYITQQTRDLLLASEAGRNTLQAVEELARTHAALKYENQVRVCKANASKLATFQSIEGSRCARETFDKKMKELSKLPFTLEELKVANTNRKALECQAKETRTKLVKKQAIVNSSCEEMSAIIESKRKEEKEIRTKVQENLAILKAYVKTHELNKVIGNLEMRMQVDNMMAEERRCRGVEVQLRKRREDARSIRVKTKTNAKVWLDQILFVETIVEHGTLVAVAAAKNAADARTARELELLQQQQQVQEHEHEQQQQKQQQQNAEDEEKEETDLDVPLNAVSLGV